MTDEEVAFARHQMLARVPPQSGALPQEQVMDAVSFSLSGIETGAVTLRLVDDAGQLLDLRLNNVVAAALGHCIREVQNFAIDPIRDGRDLTERS